MKTLLSIALMGLLVIQVLGLAVSYQPFRAETSRNAFAQPSPAFLTYDNSRYGLSIDYPADWYPEEYPGNYFATFYSPFADENDDFSEYVGIFHEAVGSADSLDSYVSQYLNEIKDVYPDSEVLEEESTILSGLQARLVLTADTDFDEDGKLDHKSLRAFILSEARAYVVLYDAVQGTYDTYLPVVNDMLGSLTIDTSGLPDTAAEKFLTYQNSTYGVKLDYPDNWEVVTPSEDGGALAYFYLPYENDMDAVPDFAMVSFEGVSRGTSLSQYMTGSIASLSSDDPSFKLIDSKDFMLAGHLGRKLTFTVDSPAYGPMTSTMAFTIVGDRAFMVGIALADPFYDKYLPKFEKMLDSFQITYDGGPASSDAQQPTPRHTTGELIAYDNPGQAFSVSYPDNWIRTEPESEEALLTGEMVSFASPTNDAFVTVAIENLLLEPMTDQEYADKTIQSLKNEVSLLKIQESAPAEFGSQPGHRLVYSGLYTFFGDTAVSVKALHMWAVVGQSRAYTLTYVALPESFEGHLPVAEKMVSSFEIDALEVPKRVSGTFDSEEMGFSMELPEGWVGAEGNSAFKEQMPFDSFIMVFPELERVSRSIENVTIEEIDPGEYASDLLSSFLIIASISMEDLMHGKLAQHNATNDDGEGKCSRGDSAAVVNIGNGKGLQLEGECSYPSLDGKYHYTGYVIMNSENAVLLALYETPDSEGQIEKFQSAIQTVIVKDPIDLTDPWTVSTLIKGKREFAQQTVYVDNNPYELKMLSNSTISDFALQEDKKQISFRVEGAPSSRGAVELELGQVLKGPYTVFVDGVVANDTFTINDSTTGRSILTFSYPHSVHQITITGTNVVPEFENLALFAVAIGIVATLAVLRNRPRIHFGYPRN